MRGSVHLPRTKSLSCPGLSGQHRGKKNPLPNELIAMPKKPPRLSKKKTRINRSKAISIQPSTLGRGNWGLYRTNSDHPDVYLTYIIHQSNEVLGLTFSHQDGRSIISLIDELDLNNSVTDTDALRLLYDSIQQASDSGAFFFIPIKESPFYRRIYGESAPTVIYYIPDDII